MSHARDRFVAKCAESSAFAFRRSSLHVVPGTVALLFSSSTCLLGFTTIRSIRIASVVSLAALGSSAPLGAQTSDWPVYGGNTDNTHYSRLNQITPANVSRLKVAWTFATGDEFSGSEMQANPIVIDGVLYATTPKMHVFALDAATGKTRWRFDPNN